jgi:hypothetical protein
MDREQRARMPTNRFTFGTLGGTNPTPPPVDPTTKKKPKYDWEKINDDGSSASFLVAGFLPVLAPTSPVAAGGSPVAAPTGGTSQVVITDDDWEPTSPTGTSPVGTAGGWGGLALQPPLPLMGAVGGAATGVVRARVAALEAGTGAVVNRTLPLRVRTEVVDAETQTDDMVLWSCHSCSQK